MLSVGRSNKSFKLTQNVLFCITLKNNPYEFSDGRNKLLSTTDVTKIKLTFSDLLITQTTWLRVGDDCGQDLKKSLLSVGRRWYGNSGHPTIHCTLRAVA